MAPSRPSPTRPDIRDPRNEETRPQLPSLPATDRGRALLVGIVLLSVGLLFCPWPWLAAVVPGVLFIASAFLGQWGDG